MCSLEFWSLKNGKIRKPIITINLEIIIVVFLTIQLWVYFSSADVHSALGLGRGDVTCFVSLSAPPSFRRGNRLRTAVFSRVKMAAGPLSVSSNASTNNDGILIGDKVYSEVYLTIDNSLIPEERLSPTPSMLDGLDLNTETDLRILGCELIQSAGILLRLPQVNTREH